MIVIDFSGELTWVPYVESGAAIGVHREDALTSVIEHILYDEEARQTLAEAQRRYVYESGCWQNGQASQIVADSVTQMIEDVNRQQKWHRLGSRTNGRLSISTQEKRG